MLFKKHYVVKATVA